MRNRSKLKGTKWFIAEDLTVNRYKLYKHAQQKLGRRHVWTTDGAIIYRKNGGRHKITCSEDIESTK